MGFGGQVPPNNLAFPHLDLVRPGAAVALLLDPQAQEESGRETARGTTGLGGVDSEELGCPSKPEGRAPRLPPFGTQSLALHPTPSLLAGPFPVSLLRAGATLNPSRLLGAAGPAPPSVERTRGWKWSDLIKAVAAHQVVTRSWGQPEKVVTYFFPHLTHSVCPRGLWSVSRLEGTYHPGEFPFL